MVDDIFSADLVLKTTWKDGKKDGVSSTILNDKNGEVIESEEWKDGKQHGAYYKNNNYDSLGNRFVEDPEYNHFTKAEYKNGKLDGNYSTILNNELITDLNFSEGKLNGIQKTTDRNTRIKYEAYFENDVIKGQVKEIFHDGSITEYSIKPNIIYP